MKKLIAFLMLAISAVYAQTTPNLGLQLPNYQSPNWGVALNYNFTRLDGFLSGGYTLPPFISQGITLTNLTPGNCVEASSSGQLITAGGACSTFNLTTNGTSGPATLTNGILNIPQYNPIPAGSSNQLLYYASAGNVVSPLSIGTGLSISGGVLSSTGGTTLSALTAAASGGASPGATFNGSAAVTFDYHTLGAAGVTGTPQSGNCVEWTSATTVGDTGAPCNAGSFAISGFSVSPASAEIGQTVTNPTVAASYTLTPTSAAVTNTAGIGSPLTLTTPFTSGTVTGSFVENTQANVTFTLSAVYGGTKTATSSISWVPRYFYGVGTAGATGATASGTSAVLTGATGTLASGGIGASQVGVTFPVVSPTGQKIYLLLIGTGHQFVDALTGFSMPFNSPTAVSFTNQYGDVVSMELYESTNLLSGNYQPKVTQ